MWPRPPGLAQKPNMRQTRAEPSMECAYKEHHGKQQGESAQECHVKRKGRKMRRHHRATRQRPAQRATAGQSTGWWPAATQSAKWRPKPTRLPAKQRRRSAQPTKWRRKHTTTIWRQRATATVRRQSTAAEVFAKRWKLSKKCR